MLVQKALIAILLLSVLVGCTRLGSDVRGSARVVTNPIVSTANALSATDLTDFLDPQAARALTANEKAEAASAQYYALQFGRPGAPRSWQGDGGSSGKVTVGPYVRVNQLDCREFSHEVKTSQKSFLRSGTACREGDGRWSAV